MKLDRKALNYVIEEMEKTRRFASNQWDEKGQDHYIRIADDKLLEKLKTKVEAPNGH